MRERDEEIIAVVRRNLEAFGRGDFDTAIEGAHPDVELVTADGLSRVRGADELRAWMEPETMIITSVELDEIVLCGDKVLVLQHNHGRGVSSGIEVDMRFWSVWTFNDEIQVTSVEVFVNGDEATARRAAGLSD